jgi:hypothetical protein
MMRVKGALTPTKSSSAASSSSSSSATSTLSSYSASSSSSSASYSSTTAEESGDTSGGAAVGSGISEGHKTDNDKDSRDGSAIYHPGAAASNNVDFKAHLNAMLHNAVRLVVK